MDLTPAGKYRKGDPSLFDPNSLNIEQLVLG